MLVYLTCPVVPTSSPTRSGCKHYALKSVCSTDLSCYPYQHPCQKWVQLLCTQIWMCTAVLCFGLCLLVCQLDLPLSSTVLVCQQVFPPLGCVSLPNLSCYPNQPPSQKWVQILCTQICVFNCTCLSTSIPTPRVCQSA